jgi:hypothetical protein
MDIDKNQCMISGSTYNLTVACPERSKGMSKTA